MFCPKCGKEQQEGIVFCSNCGAKISENTSAPVTTEDAGIGLKILSLLIPLVGGIMYLVWHKDYPAKAKSCGTFALIGFVINLIIYAMM